jgi:hypothetical protein
MTKTLYQIATIIFFATAGFAAQAQENAQVEFEITESERERYEREKVMFSPGGEGEARYVAPRTQPTGSSSGAPKDSIATATKQPPAAVTPVRKVVPGKNPIKQLPPKQEDDAILSFNFLYYIIQKYKLQQIIE